MASNCKQIEAELVDFSRNLSDRLCRVRVKANPALPCDQADVLDRLDGADLIVGVHNANQDRLRSNGAAHVLRIDSARAIDGKVGDRSAEPFEKPAGSKNSGMLDCRGDDVEPPLCG